MRRLATIMGLSVLAVSASLAGMAQAGAGVAAIGLGGAFPWSEEAMDGAPDSGTPGLRLSDPDARRPFADGVGIPGSPFLDFERQAAFTPRIMGLRMGIGGDRDDGPTSGILDYRGQIGAVRLGATFAYGVGEADRQNIAADEPMSLAAGVQASLGDFDLSVGYFWIENATSVAPDRRAQAVGVGYNRGPLRLGLSVLDPIGDGRKQPLDLGGAGDDSRRYSFGGVYSSGPGLQLGASVNLDDGRRTDGRGEGSDNLLLLFGTVVRF